MRTNVNIRDETTWFLVVLNVAIRIFNIVTNLDFFLTNRVFFAFVWKDRP